jgi:hypothetical protein
MRGDVNYNVAMNENAHTPHEPAKNRLAVLANRSADIFRKEGLNKFASHAADYLATYLFKYEEYFVVEHTLVGRDKGPYLPLTDDYEIVVVRDHAEADKLARRIGYDFRRHLLKSTERLDAGAVAFCILVGGKFAGISYACLNLRAKMQVDPTPFKIDYSKGKAGGGGVYTFPEYRNLRLMQYGQWARFEYLLQHGIKHTVGCINVKNTASQFVNTKFDVTIRGKGILLTVLGIRFWREVPVKDSELPVGMERSKGEI